MLPYITLFGRTVPTYSAVTILGIFLAGGYLFFRSRALGKGAIDHLLLAFASSLGGMVVGAKVLYWITVLPQLIRDIPALFTRTEEFLLLYVYSGMVFYGGLLGAIAGCLLYLRKKEYSFRRVGGVMTHTIPLIAAFGRVGCFSEGCCYGIETDGPLGVVFHRSAVAPNGVAVLPTQLFEAAFDLLLFAALLVLHRKGVGAWRQLGWYLTGYSVFRFVLEFFRGDPVRGFVGMLSTSQFISIFVLAWGLWLLLRKEKSASPPL